MAALLAVPSVAMAAGVTSRVNVGAGGVQANGETYATDPAVTGDGRIVMFASPATNLVAGDTNDVQDVFARSLVVDATVRVSVSDTETQATGRSLNFAVSSTGRFIAFASSASNLVPGDTNNTIDIFVRDTGTGTTSRVSVSSSEAQATGGEANNPAISADGRFVAFESSSSNLVSGDTNGRRDIFVRDRQAGTTTRVNVSGSSGAQSLSGDSQDAAISADGRFVAFSSRASNLVSGDTNFVADVFVHDRSTGSTSRVSLTDVGGQASGGGGFSPSISGDGRLVAFSSQSADLVAGDTAGHADIFLRDRQANTTTRLSVSSAGAEANAFSAVPAISADGRFVTFLSDADNIVENDTNLQRDIFVHEIASRATTRVSVGSTGVEGDGESTRPAISGDGRFVAFVSRASNLVPGDTNGQGDVFVHDRTPPPPPAPATISYDAQAGLSIVDGAGDAASLGVLVVRGLYRVEPLAATLVPLVAGPGCAADGPVMSCSVTGVGLLSAELGDGNDRFNGAGCPAALGDATINGGPGQDLLVGGPGPDILRGDGGDDTLSGCQGNDTLDGGLGNDLFRLGELDTGVDTIIGGGGLRDRVEYIGAAPVNVTLDGNPGDGPVGAGDNVNPDVEAVTGGSGPDTITGNAVTNRFIGGAGNDVLAGGSEPPPPADPTSAVPCRTGSLAPCGDDLDGGDGADNLLGEGGEDILTGGTGVDQLRGGDHNDTINARDGEEDRPIDCGAGTDLANVDLRDIPDSNCENLDQGAVREGPHVVLGVRRALRLRGGRVTIRISCPRRLGHACRGSLAAARTQRALRRAPRTSYEVPAGRRRIVHVRAAAGVRRGRTVYVQSIERGDVQGNKTTRRLARTARRG